MAAIVAGVPAYWRGLYAGRARRSPRPPPSPTPPATRLARQYVLGYLALDAADHDGPQAARGLLAEASPDAGEPQVGEHFTAMIGHLALGRAAELEGHLGEAERELARAGELSRRGAGILEQAAAALAHARVLAALERRDTARARLAQARALLSRCADAGVLARALRQAEHAPGLAAAQAPAGSGEALSERELGVLRLLHSELSLREIGAELFVSLNTDQDPHAQHLPQARRRQPRRGGRPRARARAAVGALAVHPGERRRGVMTAHPCAAEGRTHARGRTLHLTASGPGG